MKAFGIAAVKFYILFCSWSMKKKNVDLNNEESVADIFKCLIKISCIFWAVCIVSH